MLVEKYLLKPRHVEIQVFCDSQGNGVYLFERDCSVQRRHQKVIEEAPAPGMTEALRQQMGEAAIKAAQAINYEGAGTVEFLAGRPGPVLLYGDEHSPAGRASGHRDDQRPGPGRVAAAGCQLVRPLPCTQEQLQMTGHAFEARIYAEDPRP